MMNTCGYTLYIRQTHRMYPTKSEANIYYGLWVIMMCQYKFMDCNKRATMVGDVGNGAGYT